MLVQKTLRISLAMAAGLSDHVCLWKKSRLWQTSKMKQLAWTCAIAVITFLGAASAQDRTGREAADRAELSRLEETWNQAHLHGDAEALNRLWADDLEVAVP